jgi:hypothetical protein
MTSIAGRCHAQNHRNLKRVSSGAGNFWMFHGVNQRGGLDIHVHVIRLAEERIEMLRRLPPTSATLPGPSGLMTSLTKFHQHRETGILARRQRGVNAVRVASVHRICARCKGSP